MSIKTKLKNLSSKTGVYQMFDKHGKIIYVGKAKNLKKRVAQYFKQYTSGKTSVLAAHIKSFEVIITTTETQALLLENELIKRHQPKYNVLLKDGKSYPYIYISDDKHPRVGFYRGNRGEKYQFFGPYPSAQAVRQSLTLLGKIFKLRQCSNAVYRVRSRPCLDYQIGLCSAPCVGKITDENYAQDGKMMALFLSGKGAEILSKLSKKMQQASQHLDFEGAAHYRDQLVSLRSMQEQHSSKNINNMDVVSIVAQQGVYALEVLFIRDGKQIGQVCLFPKNTKNKTITQVLSAFLPLYYLGKQTPKQLLLSHKLQHKKLISTALSTTIIDAPNKDKRHFLNIANLTAAENLNQHLLKKSNKKAQLLQLQKVLGLQEPPQLMECFDISHTMGESPCGACVVFVSALPQPAQYRQFNIKNITPGDDYGAIAQVVYRRYLRLLKEHKPLPKVAFIDGGLGQLNQAQASLNSIGIEEIKLVAVAKGEGRKAGLETLIVLEQGEVKKINLAPHHPALLLVNHIRDEAHRFALKQHRKKRSKKRQTSSLQSIEGIGKLRTAALLNHFGGIQAIQTASKDELQKVGGINQSLATKIMANFSI